MKTISDQMQIPSTFKQKAKREALNLLSEVSGVKAVVISSIDGFDFVSAVGMETDPYRLAAMTSSILAIGSVVANESALGSLEGISIYSQHGFVQVFISAVNGISIIIFANAMGVSPVFNYAVVNYRGRALAKTLQNE